MERVSRVLGPCLRLGLALGRLFFLGAVRGRTGGLGRAAFTLQILQSRVAQARVVFFGLQPFLGDVPSGPLELAPIAQPAGRDGPKRRRAPRPSLIYASGSADSKAFAVAARDRPGWRLVWWELTVQRVVVVEGGARWGSLPHGS